MEGMNNVEKEISILDLCKLLLSKIKILIISLLIGAVVGAALGFFTTFNVDYYGTSVEFYINPETEEKDGDPSSSNSQYAVYGSYGRNVMDAITKLLSSESFTEQLMLEENGLPSKTIYPGLSENNYSEVEAARQAEDAAWKKVENLKEVKNTALQELDKAWKNLGQEGSFNETVYKILKANNSYDETSVFAIALEVAYEQAQEAKVNYEDALVKAKEAQTITEEKEEKLLNEWRLTKQYMENMKRYSKAMSFAYLGEDEDIEDANDLARSFIYVKISVLNDEDFAKETLERVKRYVPKYVETNMIVPTGYVGTSCTRITRSDAIALMNPNYTTSQMIKYGMLLALVGFVIAAVVVILIDRSDKRLRDTETISENFQVPVLAVIPEIEEISVSDDKKDGE